MSGEHCPDCGAVVGAGCGCAPDAGFNPLRIRPYVTLPDPGEPEPPLPPQPVTGVVAAAVAPDGTPPYGIPGAPPAQPWPNAAEPSGPALSSGDAAETVQLPAIPAEGTVPASASAEFPVAGATAATAAFPAAEGFPGAATAAFPAFPGAAAGSDGGTGGGGGGGPEKRLGGRASRRLLPLLLGAAAVVALGGTALAVWVLPESAGSDTALLDAKASAPPAIAPATSSQAPSPSASASASASRSASPSPSKSPSPSASRSATSAPPSPSASASRSPSPSKPPATSAPTLRYGDSGPEVEKLQRLLAAQGLFSYKINGKFDWRVENAVSTFQFNNDIDEEWGVYGPITRRALEG